MRDPHFAMLVSAVLELMRKDGGYLTPVETLARELGSWPDRAANFLYNLENYRPSQEVLDFSAHFHQWISNMGYRNDNLWRLRRYVESENTQVSFQQSGLIARGLAVCSSETKKPIVGNHPDFLTEKSRTDMTLRVVEVIWSDDLTTRRGSRPFLERKSWHLFVDQHGSRYEWSRTHPTEDADQPPELVGKEGLWWRLRATIKALSVDERGRAVTHIERVALDRQTVAPPKL